MSRDYHHNYPENERGDIITLGGPAYLPEVDSSDIPAPGKGHVLFSEGSRMKFVGPDGVKKPVLDIAQYSDYAAMAAATGFVASDIGRIAQLADGSQFKLVGYAPTSWAPLGLSSGYSDPHVPTIEALQAVDGSKGFRAVTAACRSTVGDGGGGSFVWRTGTAPTDPQMGVYVPGPTGSGGYWERNGVGTDLDARWFGAKAEDLREHIFVWYSDAAHTIRAFDNAVPVQAAIDFAAAAGRRMTVVLPAVGSKLCSDNALRALNFNTTLTMRAGVKLRGAGYQSTEILCWTSTFARGTDVSDWGISDLDIQTGQGVVGIEVVASTTLTRIHFSGIRGVFGIGAIWYKAVAAGGIVLETSIKNCRLSCANGVPGRYGIRSYSIGEAASNPQTSGHVTLSDVYVEFADLGISIENGGVSGTDIVVVNCVNLTLDAVGIYFGAVNHSQIVNVHLEDNCWHIKASAGSSHNSIVAATYGPTVSSLDPWASDPTHFWEDLGYQNSFPCPDPTAIAIGCPSGKEYVGAKELQRYSTGTTQTELLSLVTRRAAAADRTQENSPGIRLTGNAWTGSASVPVDAFLNLEPAPGASPEALVRLFSRINGGSLVELMAISQNRLRLWGHDPIQHADFITVNGVANTRTDIASLEITVAAGQTTLIWADGSIGNDSATAAMVHMYLCIDGASASTRPIYRDAIGVAPAYTPVNLSSRTRLTLSAGTHTIYLQAYVDQAWYSRSPSDNVVSGSLEVWIQ
jgi:hypothetical protein